MIKGCLFDLDGTLTDTLYDLGNSTNIVLEEFGYPTHPLDAYKTFVGNGVYKLVERALGDNASRVDACYKRFNEVYKEHFLDQSDLYPGIKEMLETLEDMHIKVGVVTNKPHQFATKLTECRIHTPLVCVYGEQVNLYPKKPDSTVVTKALQDLNLSNDEVFFIGDSNVDIQTAKNAHLKSIGVLWGFRSKQELEDEGANYIVSQPSEIIEIIQTLNGEK